MSGEVYVRKSKQAGPRQTTATASSQRASLGAIAAVAAVFAGFLWWTRRQRGGSSSRQASGGKAATGRPAAPTRNGRSAFSFGPSKAAASKPGKQQKGSAGGSSSLDAPLNLAARNFAPVGAGLPQGNAKKDKKLRRARKEEKQARKRAAEEEQELQRTLDNRLRRAEGEGVRNRDGSVTYTYVDFEKTSEAYNNLANAKAKRGGDKEPETLRLV